MNRAIERHGTLRNAPETTVQMWSGKTGWGIWDRGVGVIEVVAGGRGGRLVQCRNGMLHGY